MSSTYRVGYPPVHADWKNQIETGTASTTPRENAIKNTNKSIDAEDMSYKTPLYGQMQLVCNNIYHMDQLCDTLDLDLRKLFPDKELIDSYEYKMSYEPKETIKNQLLLNDLTA